MMAEWIEKCLKCKHSYMRKTDEDEMFCNCRSGECRYEERKLQIAEHQRFLQTGIHGEIGFVGIQKSSYRKRRDT